MNSSRRQFAASLWAPLAFARHQPAIVLSCSPRNDLYRALSSVPRFSTPEQAIRHVRPGTGVAILADTYPETPIAFPDHLIAEAKKKRLRVYAEYVGSGKPLVANRERAVVASSFFGDALPPMSILSLHACHYLPLSGGKTHLALAKVAGFDKAVYGLPQQVYPLLIEREPDQILIASTQLSRFVTARYGPSAAWVIVWKQILRWLLANQQDVEIRSTPSVRPTFSASAPLPADAE